MEYWKNIVGYENLYQVSNYGSVKSLEKKWFKSNKTLHIQKEKIIKPRKTKDGYLIVNLCKNKKQKTFSIHRIVCIHFLFNLNNKEHVNHKNGIKHDNNVKNLEWCTMDENFTHAKENGLTTKGIKNGRVKLSENDVYQIKFILIKVHQKEIAKKFGVSQGLISQIKLNKIWDHIKK